MTTALRDLNRTPKAPVVIEYPESDDMAESLLQHLIIEFLRPLVERYLREVLAKTMPKSKTDVGHRTLRKHKPYCVGGDQLWYYEEGNPKKCLAPDVYVLAGEEQIADRSSVKLWELSGFPLFALEIVGQNKEKDYRDSPEKFALTGLRELVVYDPDVPHLVVAQSKRRPAKAGRERYRWQVWRDDANNGWSRVEVSNDDRVYSESLCCWLFVQGTGPERKVRVATGDRGAVVFLTGEEAQAQRADTEAQRADTEAQRAEAEAQRAATESRRAEAEAQRAATESRRAEAEAQRAATEAQRADAAADRAERAELELAKLRASLGSDSQHRKLKARKTR